MKIENCKMKISNCFWLLLLCVLCGSNSMAREIKVDISQVKNLTEDFHEMLVAGGEALTERGVQLLREEAPKKTGQLRLGMSGDFDRATMRGSLTASARRAESGARSFTVSLKGGGSKTITLRPQPPFDYAQAVAEGTGLYGPRRALIKPKSGKALLIPLNDNFPIFRRSSKGMKPNPYDERAAKRLEGEAQNIFERVVEAFANLEKQ